MHSSFVYSGWGHLRSIPFDPLIKWSWWRKKQSETSFMHWISIEWSPYGIKKMVTYIKLSSYFGTIWLVRFSVFRRLLVVHMLLVHQPSPKARGICWAHFWADGRSGLIGRTVRECAELVRVSSFLWDLLAKSVGLTWETTWNGYRPSLFI
jgi:hypothetical protein